MNSKTVGYGAETVTVTALKNGVLLVSIPRGAVPLDREDALALHEALGNLLHNPPDEP